jgi:hypothetical protein
MLRALVILLMLGNAAFWAWTQGWLTGVVGIRPTTGDREPERLARQVRPEHIKVLPPPSVDTAVTAASASPGAAAQVPANAVWALPDCHQLGPFTLAELPSAAAALREAWPTGRWAELREDKSGAWAIYIGPFKNPAEQQQKQKTLLQRGYTVDEPPAGRADLAGGLLLGHFADVKEAALALTKWQKQGENDARVLEIEEASSVITLRTELIDAELASRLAALSAFKSSTGQTLLSECGAAR